MFSSFSMVPVQNIRFQSFSSQRLFVSCFQMAFLCTLICTEKCLPMELCSSRMQSKIWLKAFTNALQRTDRAFNRQTQLNSKSQVRTKSVFCFFLNRYARRVQYLLKIMTDRRQICNHSDSIKIQIRSIIFPNWKYGKSLLCY